MNKIVLISGRTGAGRDSEKNIEYMRKYNKANREKILKDKNDYYCRRKAELLKSAVV